MHKLLLVDDDIFYGQQLSEALRKQGWHVDIATRGEDGAKLLKDKSYDFVLLDWNLPDVTGLEICRQFRASGGQTPIIFLTARMTVEDKESALDAGGDDYVTKPFDAREVLARMRTIERRSPVITAASHSVNGFVLNPSLRTLAKGEEKVQLSAIETNILELLFRHRNRFFSSAQMLLEIWPDGYTSEDNVRVHVRLLRRKLAAIGAENLVKTVRSAGYIVEDGA